ncbi:MAG TPA: hypothetical protein VFX85_05415, partial [Solirubrobacterales bacterium]|nr:hypothetical protein [Solirubrobacterales bacterium]
HAHPLPDFVETAGGTLTAPDHNLPSRLRFELTATDSRGLSTTKSIEVDPRAATLTAVSSPAGATLGIGAKTGPGPVSVSLIEGASTTLSAPETLVVGGVTYQFDSWSDGGPRVHSVLADTSTDYTAFYVDPNAPRPGPGSQPPGPGSGPPPPAGGAAEAATPGAPELKRRPAARTRAVSARFEFIAPDADVGFACKLDERALEPCGSPRVYRKLKPGKHVFHVYAEAPGESLLYSPATIYRWRVLEQRRPQAPALRR